jgi:hypothetical protein
MYSSKLSDGFFVPRNRVAMHVFSVCLRLSLQHACGWTLILEVPMSLGRDGECSSASTILATRIQDCTSRDVMQPCEIMNRSNVVGESIQSLRVVGHLPHKRLTKLFNIFRAMVHRLDPYTLCTPNAEHNCGCGFAAVSVVSESVIDSFGSTANSAAYIFSQLHHRNVAGSQRSVA